MKLNICEIFSSLQGETTTAGFPALFIRLAGCNLRCTYCDSTHSFKTEYETTIDDLIERVKEHKNIHHICLTGGEPLLQANVYNLIEKLVALRYNIQVETNGSQSLKFLPACVKKIVDVKGPSSGEWGSFLDDNLNYLTENDEVKFVIGDYTDFKFAESFIKEKLENTKSIINFSPAFNAMPVEKLANLILEKNLNVRLNLQLHKIIWPAGEPGAM